jgi:hypothetical protein
MPDLADLYPGFASHRIDTSGGAHLRAQRREGAAAPSAARLSADQPLVFDYPHCVASVLHAMDGSNRSEKTDLTSLLPVVEENRVRKS